MAGLLRRLIHELGTGRALENARRERDETRWTCAAVDAIGRRVGRPDEAKETVAA
jgi:hypothetical protein